MAAPSLGHATRWHSTTTWGSARWQWGLAAVIAAVIFWPFPWADPAVGCDPSWQAGLAVARAHHLAWGSDIVFTYGPLGFLENYAYYSFGQSVLATIYQQSIVAALYLGIAAALRQRNAPMTSLIGAFVTTGVIAILGLPCPELEVLAAFAWGTVPLLQHEVKRSTVLTTCLVLGAVAGLQLVVKFNTGLSIVAIALATSVLVDRRAIGRHCATVGAFAASTLIWWVIAGQRLRDLPTWFRSSAAMLSGYLEAMDIPLSPSAVLSIVLTLAWIAMLCVMFARGRPEIPRGFVVLVGLATVINVRYAVGRFNQWHFFILLFVVIVVAVAITPLSRTRRRTCAAVALATVLVGLSAQRVLLHALGDDGHDRITEAVQMPGQAVDRLLTLALPGHANPRIERAKARQRALYAIPDRFIRTVRSGTVHIDPTETSAVWAYDLAWRPAPVFQTYAAYTPKLDELNSESLTKGPQFVLSRLSAAAPAIGAIDGRLGVQESPRYSRALLCDYTVSGVENRWALFTHTGPHCGPLTPLSEVTVRSSDAITVPAPSAPDMTVLVGIDLQPTVIDRFFGGTVAPLTISTVALDGVNYRLVAANAAEPFLVNTPASVAGTNLQIHAHTISVGRAPSLGQGDVSARLRFYEMRVGHG